MTSIDIDAVMSRLNPLVVAILRTPILHWLLSPGLILLTVTGRRSGRRYTIPVGVQRDGDRLIVLVSQAQRKQWWRNYRDAGPVEMRLRGRSARGQAIALTPEGAEFQQRIEQALRRVPGMARVFGVEGYDRKRGIDLEQLDYLRRQIAIVRIELDQRGQR